MTRENAAAKARRYLVEGRLIVRSVTPRRVDATCRGDGERHHQRWTPTTGWACTCPARTDRCCHLDALRLVVAIDLDPATGAAPPTSPTTTTERPTR